MNIRKQKKQIPAEFRKQMYENYKANMAFYGKPISSYKQWLKDVFNTQEKWTVMILLSFQSHS